MTARVAQNTVSKVVIFYKNGDRYFRGYRMAITPRRYRNMETLLNDLTRLLGLPLGARYVLTKSGKSVENVDEFQNGQGYICSSFPKLKNVKYGVADHLPYWNSSKQTGKVKLKGNDSVTHKPAGNERVPLRKVSDSIKSRIISVIRYGHKPRRMVKVLLNKRTAQTFDQVLDEVTNAIGVWGTNGVRRLYNMKGERISDVSDLFKDDDCFIAVGNERFQLSDLDDKPETTVRPWVVQKTKLPGIHGTNETDISQIADKDKPTPKVKSRNSVKLPVIGRKSSNDYETNNTKHAGQQQHGHKQSKDTDYTAKNKPTPVSGPQILNSNTNKHSDLPQGENLNENGTAGKVVKVSHQVSGGKLLDHDKVLQDKTERKHENVEDVYILGEKIGDGNFAVVRIGIKKETKTKYALKIIDRKKIKGKEDMLNDEIRIMNGCHHENIAQLYETYHTPFDIYLVMEYVSGGDLFDEISNFVKFEEPTASSFARDIVKALDYLHQQHVVHRDLKPENLLVHINSNGKKQLKLADFGLAVEVRTPLFTVCGTPTYVAPEILEETGYGLKVDIWAAGVIVYIMLCGFPPFRSANKDQDELFDLIVAGDYEFLSPYWDNVSTKAKDLLKHLLVVDTKKRYTAQQILAHPWLELEDKLSLANSTAVQSRRSFDARRKFKGAAIAVKGTKKFQNIAKEFQLKRDEKLIA